jgi:hypothetical protein
MKVVSSVTLEIDGEEEDNFSEITEPEVEHNKPVDLMNKTAHIEVTRRYKGIKIKYLVPSDEPERDFSKVEDSTLTIVYKNGTRRTYSGVYVNKIGGETYKDGAETVRDIELSAEARNPK